MNYAMARWGMKTKLWLVWMAPNDGWQVSGGIEK